MVNHDGKILVATVAFGLGIDSKGLNHILFGPPAELDDYLR